MADTSLTGCLSSFWTSQQYVVYSHCRDGLVGSVLNHQRIQSALKNFQQLFHALLGTYWRFVLVSRLTFSPVQWVANVPCCTYFFYSVRVALRLVFALGAIWEWWYVQECAPADPPFRPLASRRTIVWHTWHYLCSLDYTLWNPLYILEAH